MSRYIDADAYRKKWADIFDSAYGDSCCDMFKKSINEQPTADVIPIKWIKEQKDKCFPDSITAIALKHLLTEWERREDGTLH